jgi:hypothetical protein
VLLEQRGKAGALCQPAKLGHQHCPLIVRPTSEDNITSHLVHGLKLVSSRHWVSDFLNSALGCERFPRKVYRRFRIEPWVAKPPFPRDLVPWEEGGTEVDMQITWENPPTTVFVEAKYGSVLSSRTNRNDGSHGYPSDQLIRNVRVGLYECGLYKLPRLFESPTRELVVIVLAPERGQPLVREYRDPERLKTAIPQSHRIIWPRFPFVGEIGYGDIRKILLTRRRFTSRTEGQVIDALLEYLQFKHQSRPNRSSLPVISHVGGSDVLSQSQD